MYKYVIANLYSNEDEMSWEYGTHGKEDTF